MRLSSICCLLGSVFVFAISALHGSGFAAITAEFVASNASDFLKRMFPVLYAMPSLYCFVLGVLGLLAFARAELRRPVGLILAPATMAAGALALLVGESLPLIVMGAGSLLFLVAALWPSGLTR